MKSPSSMRASKRCSSSISSAERTPFLPSGSLPWVSIACVYMASFLLLGPLVEDALRLAGQGALDRVGLEHRHRGGHADHALDAVPHPPRDLADLVGPRAGVR